jgi:hypothetical protein
MDRKLPITFWLESFAAAASTLLFVVTLITPEWIELLTGLEPDRGSGTLEIAIAVGLAAVAVGSGVLARSGYRRAVAA